MKNHTLSSPDGMSIQPSNPNPNFKDKIVKLLKKLYEGLKVMGLIAEILIAIHYYFLL